MVYVAANPTPAQDDLQKTGCFHAVRTIPPPKWTAVFKSSACGLLLSTLMYARHWTALCRRIMPFELQQTRWCP